LVNTSELEVLRRPVEFADRPVVGVEDRPGQRPAGRGGGLEGVLDEAGAHVVGDRPTSEPPAVAVDHGGQVQVGAVGQRQVRDVADVAVTGRLGGEVPVEQVGDLLPRRLGDRGPHPPLLLVAADPVLAHHPRDPLVVDPLTSRCVVVELRGDPRCATGLVLGVDGPDPLDQFGVRGRSGLTCRGRLDPGVVGGTLDLDELA
jgi:hypothetical protein